jgi:hypothetical protein
MIRLLLLFTALLLAPLHAVQWENHTYGCAATLPESAGWQPVEPPEIPGLTTLVVVQNASRGAVFGITVLNAPTSPNLRDPETVKTIDGMLRSFGYEFFGSATTVIGGMEWKQYNVKSNAGGQIATGVIRYTSHNGKIFGLSMLLSGGKEAAQDPELQAIAGTFRFLPVTQPPPTAPAPIASTPATPKPDGAPAPEAAKPAQTTEPKKTSDTPEYVRYAIMGAVGLVLILIVLKLIGGGDAGGSVRKR